MTTPISVEDMELGKYLGHDAFLDAVDAVVTDLTQPLQWNDWQQLFSRLMAEGEFADAPRDRKLWASLRNQFMKEKFGDDWKVKMPKRAYEVSKSTRLASILEASTAEAQTMGPEALEDPDGQPKALDESASGAAAASFLSSSA